MSPSARVALRIEQDTPCPGCGYNLRGLRLDARCPECGRATIDTFARPVGAPDGEAVERMLKLPIKGMLGLTLLGIAADFVPGATGRLVFALLAGGLVVLLWTAVGVLMSAYNTRQQMRHYTLSDVVGDALGLWTLLCAAAAMLLLALPASTAMTRVSPAVLVSGLVGATLLGGAALALVAANAMGGFAGLKLLTRFGHRPAAAVLPIGVAGGLMLVGLGAVLPVRDPFTLAAALACMLLGWPLTLVANWRLLNAVREAQGSVVSIGRRLRRRGGLSNEHAAKPAGAPGGRGPGRR